MNALRVMGRVRGGSDLVLAIAALSLVSLLFAPLPPWLLDFAIAANITLTATVLVVSLFARDALRFTSFPSLLLFTTLFRLALEVSATRLVLTRGDAGRVIHAFGEAVVAGNWVVGAVVYVIVTIVQLFVVTKGSERVAEVAARFTLDALPGKQMSIDADLRSGAIDQAEARRRRRSLEREGQLYGAMDGALKFVKGDAMAGVVIVLVNVTGGLVAGALRGLPLDVAAHRYTLLAIGDGLAAQIPALLVSIAAGVAVTRVAAEEEGTALSEELGHQLFSDPKALFAVSGLSASIALLPGLPAAPFLFLAAVFGGGAWLITRSGHAGLQSGPRAVAKPPDATTGGRIRGRPPLLLELAPDLATLSKEQGDPLVRKLFPALEAELERDLGIQLPSMAVGTAPLQPGCWRLLIDDVPTAAGHVSPLEALALIPARELELLGIEAAADLDPISGDPAARIAASSAARAAALVPVRSPLERVGASIAASLRSNAHELIGVEEVQTLMEGLETTHPCLVREVSRQVPAPVLTQILRHLLEEQISIRPLKTILEALLEGGGQNGLGALTEKCRRALGRQIAHRHASAGRLDAILVDPVTETMLRHSATATGPSVDPEAVRSFLDALGSRLADRGMARSPVLLSSAEVRRGVWQLVAVRFPRLAVLSYEELPPALPIRPIDRIGLPLPRSSDQT